MEALADIWSGLPALTKAFVIGTTVLGGMLSTALYSAPAVVYGPSMLMSIGIFGTFLGIAVGLSEFDVNDIQGSIGPLLAGLKTSFWSSISGLLFALVIKARQLQESLFSNDTESITGATIDDLANGLSELRHALAGDDDSTVVGQIKLGRQDVNDRLDNLRKDLQEFLQEITKSGTEALIEALQEVIADFNAKINEQFGENFKQLNEAVGKILEWQERYREQMQELIDQEAQSASNLKKASEGFDTSVRQSEKFNEVAASLERLITSLNTERDQLYEMTKSLADTLSECKSGIPELEAKVVGLAEVLEKATRETSETAVRSISAANSEINQHINELSERTGRQVEELDHALSEQLSQSLEMFGRQMAALSEKFVADYTPLTDRLREVVRMAGNTKQ